MLMQPQIDTKVSQRSEKTQKRKIKKRTTFYAYTKFILSFVAIHCILQRLLIYPDQGNATFVVLLQIFYAVIKINANGENKFVAHSQIIIMMLTNKN